MASAGSMRTSTARITPSSPASPRAGRQLYRLGPRPLVANDRLRHILIGSARVSKADGSQSLDPQRDALRAAGVDAVHVYHDFRLGRSLTHLVNTVQDLSTGVGLRVLTGQGCADRHHHRCRPPRIRHLRGAGRVRAGADPRTHPGRAHGRADATAAGGSRCRKPRCGWPRSRWRTATPPCPRSAVNSGSIP